MIDVPCPSCGQPMQGEFMCCPVCSSHGYESGIRALERKPLDPRDQTIADLRLLLAEKEKVIRDLLSNKSADVTTGNAASITQPTVARSSQPEQQ